MANWSFDVKVTNDVPVAPDSRLISILVLLDLIAAFDTANHNIVLEIRTHCSS